MDAGEKSPDRTSAPPHPATPSVEDDLRPAGPVSERDRPADGIAPAAFLSWPPPGLERLQGDLWMVIRQMAVGSIVLVVPLLIAVATEQEFWSLGPFGQSWWILLATSLVGLGGLVQGFVGLFRIFRRGASATDRGYGWLTVVEVVSDNRRDTGFLLQGARFYSVLESEERRRLLILRLVGAALLFAAVLWLPVGFAVSVLLAARGVLGPGGVWTLTLAPIALLVLLGGAARLYESRAIRRTKKQWFTQSWSQDLARDEVGEWNRRLEARGEEAVLGAGGRKSAPFRAGALVVVALVVLVALPALTLMFTSSFAPLVASISVPGLQSVQEKAATVEALRAYRVETDGSITPRAAGEALHALTFAGTGREPQFLERAPARRYGEPIFPDARGGPTGLFPGQWAERLFPRVASRGLSDEEREYLGDVADHPALAELRLLARAPRMDVTGARLSLPLPDSAAFLTLPSPKFSAVREAAYALIGAAALHMDAGRMDEAEETLRQVVSAGLLMADEGTTLLDNLVGIMIAHDGGLALEQLYESSGQAEDAQRIRAARQATERAAELAAVGRAEQDLQAVLRGMPDVVEDRDALRGLRWEYFAGFNTFAPCINTHKVVFGPDASYEGWLERVRPVLVRYEGEEELYALARNGWVATRGGPDGGGWMGSLLRFTLGGGGSPGSCAALYDALQDGF